MNLAKIWSDRRGRYLQETLPYWRYVMSSGGLAMGFAAILAIQGYAALLARVRESGAAGTWLPLGAAAVLAAALLWNPARTYLRQPDLVLLLRAEPRMNEYFLRSWKYGAAASGAVLAAALALYYPLYEASGAGGAAAYGAAAAALLALKALLYAGSWKERQFRAAHVRIAFASVKTAAAFASAFVLMQGMPGIKEAWLLLLWGLYAAALRVPESYKLHWEQLLELERRTRTLHEAWFGFFVDLPQRAETYRPRAYLNGLLKLIRYDRRNAELYLYWRTFLRSATALMIARMIALEALIIWIFPHAWTAASVYAVSAWLIGLQLRSLRSPREEPLLAAMSPMPEERRASSQRTVRSTANAVAASLLALPLSAVAPPALAAGCAALGLASSFFLAGKRLKT